MPMNTSDVLSLVANGLLAGAALWAAWTAHQGLYTWRKELVGHGKHEAARRLYRAALGVRESINRLRMDFIVSTPETTEQWKSVADAWAQLRLEALEAEVLLGRDVYVKIEPLRQSMARLRVALRKYLRAEKDPKRWGVSDAEFDQLDSIVYDCSTSDEDDDYTEDLKNAMSSIEDFVKPCLCG